MRGDVEHSTAPRDVLSALRRLTLFADLPPTELAELAGGSHVFVLSRDQWLFQRNDPGNSLFVVVSGRLEVVDETAPTGAEVLRTIARGAVIGDVSPAARGPRVSSVRAVHDSELVEVGREAFLRVLWSNPATAVLFSTLVSQQLNEGRPDHVAGVEPVRTIGLVSLTDELVLADLAADLIGAMRADAAVGVMYEAERAPSRMDARETFAEYNRLLQQQALANQLVLLLDDHTRANPVWSSFTVQQADALLAVATPRAPFPHGLARELRGCHLLFLGGAHEFDLQRWLDVVEPSAHHFVSWKAGNPAALERVARRILGRSLGLVFSGGGAAGLAHIGVLQAFRDAGVRVDRVGGCSMGAFVGAFHAVGVEPEEIVDVCRRELIRRRPFGDYTLPRHALIKGRRAEAMFKRVFGDVSIEELPMDYFCVSADLLSAELVVHRRGPLWEAVGISMSVPGLAPPRLWNGRLLVDGGILDNLPIDVMAERQEGPIVAVDVIGRRLTNSVNPEGEGRQHALPRIGDTLIQSMVLGSHHRISRIKALADVVIAPEVSGVPLLDFDRLDSLVAAGRTAAERALDANAQLFASSGA